ncbi:hypothetical protein [Pontibacter oryzae]|uniref:hypothetical protein n=1 Tax=Pontibacter oryzae TaxID=2304593 RepID=UPI0018F45C03|nr:hypothetical protein [Pontibacter oryzae]
MPSDPTMAMPTPTLSNNELKRRSPVAALKGDIRRDLFSYKDKKMGSIRQGFKAKALSNVQKVEK